MSEKGFTFVVLLFAVDESVVNDLNGGRLGLCVNRTVRLDKATRE